ncbi:hypothetical protein VT85_15125 [Planctomyces sp. SH-PL62]|nr:hypothetical protein VT85_15125 [Planctomyces sp. SH-PL62]
MIAACPAAGAMPEVITPGLDAQAIEVFLAEFSRRLAPEVHAASIRDGGPLVARASERSAKVLPSACRRTRPS